MPAFGDKLKSERDRQGITLQQISVSTKISTRMLQAIEEEQFNLLPGGIFNKGFIRAYARFLGVDEEETLAGYLKASGNDTPVTATDTTLQTQSDTVLQPARSRDRASADGRTAARQSIVDVDFDGAGADSEALERQLPWGIFAALLLVTALTLSLWNRFERGHASGPVAAVSTASTPVEANHIDPAEQESAAPSPSKSVVPTPAAYVRSSTTNSDLAANSPGVNTFSLLIQARKESWVTITSDEKPPVSRLMVAGSERTVLGRKQVVVRAGNSGGINFELNGKPVATQGQDGQVQTITFGPAGII